MISNSSSIIQGRTLPQSNPSCLGKPPFDRLTLELLDRTVEAVYICNIIPTAIGVRGFKSILGNSGMDVWIFIETAMYYRNELKDRTTSIREWSSDEQRQFFLDDFPRGEQQESTKPDEMMVKFGESLLTQTLEDDIVCRKLADFAPLTNYSCVTHNAAVDSKRSNYGDNLNKELKLAHQSKIFSSKGEIGVSWNSKREVTLPMEFNFLTDKRSQHHPPIEHFNMLSLTSERQQNSTSQPRLAWSSSVLVKGSKENIPGPFRREHAFEDSSNDQ
ncbi:hypothetical protein NE237_031635 [Protea cynaroides]|uniref:Uncharacterized protein n=1 Tax=Protea cynaroides TaxID=273540 RepID=A0A9Q0L1I7_9MAGN|nr:hypothetical protein NE237_031635 [Protea cynaroides]